MELFSNYGTFFTYMVNKTTCRQNIKHVRRNHRLKAGILNIFLFKYPYKYPHDWYSPSTTQRNARKELWHPSLH